MSLNTAGISAHREERQTIVASRLVSHSLPVDFRDCHATKVAPRARDLRLQRGDEERRDVFAMGRYLDGRQRIAIKQTTKER